MSAPEIPPGFERGTTGSSPGQRASTPHPATVAGRLERVKQQRVPGANGDQGAHRTSLEARLTPRSARPDVRQVRVQATLGQVRVASHAQASSRCRPCLGQTPVTLDRRLRGLHHRRHLLDREPTEETKLHDSGLRLTQSLQTLQRLVEGNQVQLIRGALRLASPRTPSRVDEHRRASTHVCRAPWSTRICRIRREAKPKK